jgi:hypothetical protein
MNNSEGGIESTVSIRRFAGVDVGQISSKRTPEPFLLQYWVPTAFKKKVLLTHCLGYVVEGSVEAVVKESARSESGWTEFELASVLTRSSLHGTRLMSIHSILFKWLHGSTSY